MAKIDLSKYGITGATDIVYNLLMSCYSRKRQKLGLRDMK